MNFQELLNQLPQCLGQKDLPIANTPGGLQYVEQGLPEFVGPDLAPSGQVKQPDKPQVMIISAAGAVGKSTLANQIAYLKQVPIWDLAQAPAVGGNSMTGQISTCFGFTLAGKVSDRLGKGELFILVDALDEARVKANEAGFDAFIENIGTIAKSSNGTPFVLLGRTQTAETTWLLLDDADVPASLVSVQPFTRSQAEQYIESRIQNFGQAAAKRIAEHRQPFESARNAILNHLEKAVGGHGAIKEEVVREFLGYAPVLETVAVLLAKEGNYQEFVSSLDALGRQPKQGGDRPLGVLEHVVTRLLEREQIQKLQHNIRPALETMAKATGWNDWDSLYSPEEQRTRLLGLILKKDFETCPEMPAAVRSKYEEQLKAWLPEHPFLTEGRKLSNKVFESYLFAIAMREYLTPLSKAVEDRVGASDYKPSRLLADFYILLGEQQDAEVVAERQIGLLYDSLLAGETDAMRVRLSIDSGDSDGEEEDEPNSEGEFELVYASSDNQDPEQIERRVFAIVEEEGLISFRHQLKDASVLTGGTVRLGGESDDFEIGPSVDIRCGHIEVMSRGLVVRASHTQTYESDGVVIEASECTSAVARNPVVRGSLAVSWPDSESYPWTDYSFDSSDIEASGAEFTSAFRRFRRIAMELCSHSKGSLAKLCDKIDHFKVLQGRPGEIVRDRLLADGILVKRGRLYHWVPAKADELLKASHSDIRVWRAGPELRDYINDIVTSNAGVF